MRKFQGYLILFFIGLGIRLAAFTINMPFQVDITTFQAWATMLYEGGLSNFYYADTFTDYPPMYMYVLWVAGAIRQAFDLAFLSPSFNLVIFTPSIIFDVITGLLIYRICRHTFDDERVFGKSFWIAFAYLANPAIIINSSVWGQVDSIHTFLLFLSLYAVSKKQSLPAYLIYGVAVLTKPQSLIVAPIFLYSAFYYWKEQNYSLKAASTMIGFAAATFGFMILLSLPFAPNFDLSPVILQYADTLGSSPFAASNAYNFHTLIGGNWHPLTPFSFHNIVGTTSIVGITFMTFFILHRQWSGKNIFLTAALLFITTFTFSVRMNERYLFPALLFLLISAVLSEIRLDKKLLALYGIFSVTLFINCADVLLMSYDTRLFTLGTPPPVTFRPIDEAMALISFINVAAALYSLKLGWDIIKTGEYPTLSKFAREIVPLAVLIVIYSITAFYNLGNTQSPQTAWTEEYGVGADFGEVRHISRFQYMTGPRNDLPFLLFLSSDGSEWDFTMTVEGGTHVFSWGERHIGVDAKYFQIVPLSSGLYLNEIAFRDQWDQLIIPYNIFTGHVLFDEQHLVPQRNSFLNSFYFDEIFHARAGYEFLHGLTVLEDSHPPMGKNFIAMSISALGMTPFAWRLPGTLAGIFMILLMYVFGRLMFRSTFWGMFTATIFAFDFMTFAQTRIATIDSYIVLFVIASYLCMYAYIRYSDTASLRKNLLFLLGSGLFIGLAIASKWQGLYAAVGLPLVFFPALYKVYKRDPREARITFASCFAFFVAIPVTIYLLSYIPFVRAMDTGDGFLTTVIENQIWMFNYHAWLQEGHPFSSRWWEWPLMIRPIFYYTNAVTDTIRQGISSFGNPAVWWTGIFATVAAIVTLRDKEKTEHRQTIIFLLIAYAAQYVPWIFVFRATFIYHYFPSVPFVVLLITFFFKTYVAPKYPNLVWAYAASVVGLFILFYPVLSGTPVSVDFVQTFLRWLPNWLLV